MIRLFYAPGEGGSSPNATLSDLDDPDPLNPSAGKGQQQQQDPPPADPPKQGSQNTPVEGVNPDGSLQEGYERNAEGQVVKKEAADPADPKEEGDGEGNDEGDNGGSFWDDVDKLRGEEIKIDYPEGVDPESPEGAYHREKFLEARAIQTFEEFLKAQNPRGYAYMLHIQAGGTDEEFMANKTISLPAYEQFKEDPDMMAAFYRNFLVNKGIDLETAQQITEKAIKDKKIETLAEQAYKDEEKTQQAELKRIDELNKAAQRKYQTAVTDFDRTITSAVNDGQGMNIIIPDADKKPFMDFLRSAVEYDNESGQIVFVKPVSTLSQGDLESLYLMYKKGNLNAIIRREAQSQNVRRLKRHIEKSRNDTQGRQSPAQNKDFVPMSAL